jgi:hypothetical protein
MKRVIIILLLSNSIPAVLAQETDSVPALGSLDQVENRMTFDNLVQQPVFELNFIDPYFDFKENVKEKTGLAFAMDYTSIYFGTNSKIGSGSSGSRMFRFYV